MKMKQKEMIRIKVRDAFKELTPGGRFFTYISEYNPPWGNDSVLIETLDFMYFEVKSGGKMTSPIVDRMLEGNPYVLPADRDKLAKTIYYKFRTNWEKLWDMYGNLPEYNPIYNYDMSETTDETSSSHATTSSEESGTSESNRVNSDTSEYYANTFENAEPDGKLTDKSVVNGELTDTGQNEKTASSTDDKSNTSRIIRNRSGNIGVTTSQNMIKQERELWSWNYFDSVFNDIDSVLACLVY